MGLKRPGDGGCGALPVNHSIFDPEAIAAELGVHYDIGEIADCVLYRTYANDVFLITTRDGERYYFKVYRIGWRSPADVAWEPRIQHHLLASGVSIASSIDRRDGAALSVVGAPEGKRGAVLFAQASEAKPQRPFTAELYTAFGRAAARLHAALDTMADRSGHRPDDIETLVLSPGHIPRTRFDPVSDERYAIDVIVNRLARELDQRSSALDWGICHGDLTLDNFTITEEGSITFFDFDLASLSWRARDPCGVYAASRLLPHAHGFWDAFLGGYRPVRAFSDDERAVPLMHAVYQFWDLGHEVSHWIAWSGQSRVSPATIDVRLREIRHWIDTELVWPCRSEVEGSVDQGLLERVRRGGGNRADPEMVWKRRVGDLMDLDAAFMQPGQEECIGSSLDPGEQEVRPGRIRRADHAQFPELPEEPALLHHHPAYGPLDLVLGVQRREPCQHRHPGNPGWAAALSDLPRDPGRRDRPGKREGCQRGGCLERLDQDQVVEFMQERRQRP